MCTNILGKADLAPVSCDVSLFCVAVVDGLSFNISYDHVSFNTR